MLTVETFFDDGSDARRMHSGPGRSHTRASPWMTVHWRYFLCYLLLAETDQPQLRETNWRRQ